MTIFKALRVRRSQGKQFIPDLRTAVPTGFAGRPRIGVAACDAGCDACATVCPTAAIAVAPMTIDLGRCVFCAECVAACPAHKLELTADPRMGATTPEGLVVRAGSEASDPVRVAAALARVFGRSLRLRQVTAGGCSGCEHELNALGNVNFDLQRYGIEWVASPRHADGLVLAGALTRTMKDAVRLAWDAMPDPRFVVAFGACAISGGLYRGAAGVDRTFLDEVIPALYVPGCPPHPLTFANAILDFLGVA